MSALATFAVTHSMAKPHKTKSFSTKTFGSESADVISPSWCLTIRVGADGVYGKKSNVKGKVSGCLLVNSTRFVFLFQERGKMANYENQQRTGLPQTKTIPQVKSAGFFADIIADCIYMMRYSRNFRQWVSGYPAANPFS